MEKLLKYRKKIDKVDSKIIKHLNKRFNIIEQVKIYKNKNNIEILNQGREDEIISSISKKLKTPNNNCKYIEEIYRNILTQSKEKQKK